MIEDLKYIIDSYGLEITIIILAVIGVMYIIKSIVEKYFATKNQKKIIEFENEIQRRTMAYKILVEKELEFYEKYFAFASTLITDIEDIETNYFKYNEKKLKEYISNVLDLIPKLKRETIIYEAYYDIRVKEAIVSLISLLQDDFAHNVENMLLKKIKQEKVKEICENVLKNLALISVLIYSREKNMSN